MGVAYKEIFEYNRKWVSEKLAINSHFFEELAKVQQPEYLFIGCSDSRANPNEITGLRLGEIFVHRNISNIVNPIDLNVISVINYAVEALKVKHIIVCGHYGCGGIDAAMKQMKSGEGNHQWLHIIEEIYRIHKEELEAIENEKARYQRLVELNVIEQSINVQKMACIRAKAHKQACPLVHRWVYDIHTGRLIDLDER